MAGYVQALWLTPKGKALDCGSLSHISFVIKNPQKFGLTDDDIKGCVKCQDAEEKGIKGVTTYTDGIESKAWDEVIEKVLKNGFLRLRKVRSNKYSFIWYANVYEFNRRTKKTLSDWAYDVGEGSKDERVIISVVRGDEPKNMTIKSLSGLAESHESLQLTTLDEMENLI